MKIGIDCRMWNETGIGRHLRNIVANISQLDRKNSYVLFFLKKDIDLQEFPGNFKKVEADILWHTFSEQTKLPIIYYKQKLDLLFVPHFNVPVFYFKKFVATIHDLTILKTRTGRATTLPYPVYLVKRLAFSVNLFFTIKRAKKIFTVSEFVKKDLVTNMGVSVAKIFLTPNAVSPEFCESSLSGGVVLKKYGIKKPYLFYVGNAHPHKNLERLLEAFAIFSKNHSEYQLVLGGNKRFFYERLEEENANKEFSNKLIFTGFIDDEDLPILYKESEAFVNPSLYEGFGIQLLEAFSCKTRVICSNTTSLPEVGGDAAYYFNPRDMVSIAETIERAVNEPKEKYVSEGITQVNKFSWEKSAQTILDVFSKLK